MKLIALTVVSFLVFTANCRDLPNGPEISVDGHNLSDGRDLPDAHELPNGPDDEASSIEPVLFSDRADGLAFPTEDADESVSIVDDVLGAVQGGFDNNYSPFVDHQLKEDGGVQNESKLRGSRCKARNACVVMGGFCVTNATLCSGRLVPEGCKGTNCQCCVPGTIETKIDNLKQDLQSLKVNLNNSNQDLNSELQLLKNNMNTSFSNVNTKLENQGTIATKIDNLEQNLQSLKVNLNNSNQDLNSELQFLKNNMNTSFSNVNTKLENQGCPAGFFSHAPWNQCFRLLNNARSSWDDAKARCSVLGLQLAHPHDPITLRRYLLTEYDLSPYYTWVNGRGSGSAMKWQGTGQTISSDNPLWFPNRPGSAVLTSDCLLLLTYEGNWKSHPNQPYYNIGCSSSRWALCELVRE